MRQTNRNTRLYAAALTVLLLGLGACSRDAEVAADTALAGLEISAPTPHELIFSAVKDTTRTQSLTLRNVGDAPLELHTLAVSGPDAHAFDLAPAALPLVIAPGAQAALAVVFAPDLPGTYSARLELDSSDPDDAHITVGLYGLASAGLQGTLEPPLQAVVDTLGYAVDVGGNALKLGTQAQPIGDEVLVPLFEKAGAGPVTLTVVARYGPEEGFPYGFFSLNGSDVERRELGQIAAENAQELLPPSAESSFDPGSQVFGVYGQAGGKTQYSLDALNTGGVEHALRVYPLRDRDGEPVADSYLVGLEEARNGDYQDAVFVLENVRPASKVPDTQALSAWESLFNGENLDGWYTYLPSEGRNRDPEGVFKVENGMLHILDVEDKGYRDFGYLATEKSYRDYHLRLEYKWGSKRFAPRAATKRDSGVLYHVTGGDRVWPRGVEYQIQEGDTGDFWLISGTTLSTTVRSPHESEPRYEQFGKPYTSRQGRFVRIVKDGTFEREEDWNTVDIIVRGDTATHMINGRVNNRAYSLHQPGGDPLTAGKILLQAEGAEVFYRNIQIRPLGDAR